VERKFQGKKSCLNKLVTLTKWLTVTETVKVNSLKVKRKVKYLSTYQWKQYHFTFILSNDKFTLQVTTHKL